MISLLALTFALSLSSLSQPSLRPQFLFLSLSLDYLIFLSLSSSLSLPLYSFLSFSPSPSLFVCHPTALPRCLKWTIIPQTPPFPESFISPNLVFTSHQSLSFLWTLNRRCLTCVLTQFQAIFSQRPRPRPDHLDAHDHHATLLTSSSSSLYPLGTMGATLSAFQAELHVRIEDATNLDVLLDETDASFEDSSIQPTVSTATVPPPPTPPPSPRKWAPTAPIRIVSNRPPPPSNDAPVPWQWHWKIFKISHDFEHTPREFLNMFGHTLHECLTVYYGGSHFLPTLGPYQPSLVLSGRPTLLKVRMVERSRAVARRMAYLSIGKPGRWSPIESYILHLVVDRISAEYADWKVIVGCCVHDRRHG